MKHKEDAEARLVVVAVVIDLCLLRLVNGGSKGYGCRDKLQSGRKQKQKGSVKGSIDSFLKDSSLSTCRRREIKIIV